MRDNSEQVTDTHMAKRYGDIIATCIERSNVTGFISRSTPHYENLLAYYSAVDMLFNNTFFLFETIKIEGKTISKQLVEKMDEVTEDFDKMKNNSINRTQTYFNATSKKCGNIHKMIMYGLQRRNLLVRMSDREPRGQESIVYWETKAGFKKGDMPDYLPEPEIKRRKGVVIGFR